MRQKYDAGSKWLIQHFAGALLRLAGVPDVASWAALPGELVQSRQLPDGLVQARLAGRPDPVLFLIEINTYPENRVAGELLDDVLLTYLDRRVIPEVVTLVLSPKGNVRVAPDLRLLSPLGGTALEVRWRVIEMWTILVTDFLPVTDPGLAPWVPLMRTDGPPEPVLRQCRDAIDRGTAGGERANLLGFAQVFGGLVYNEELMQHFFRGGQPMIESPILNKWFREREVQTRQQGILEGLDAKFGSVPEDVSAAVRVIDDEARLKALHRLTYTCDSLADFRPAVGL